MSNNYGKMTKFKDSNGRAIWEFDRLINLKTHEKGTMIFKDYPNFPGVVGYVLKDDGTVVDISDFGFFEILPEESADLDFCAKYDYRRNQQ
jgi:hypothetical protein